MRKWCNVSWKKYILATKKYKGNATQIYIYKIHIFKYIYKICVIVYLLIYTEM